MPNNIVKVRITEQAFDPALELSAFGAGRQDTGALANFVGYCRDMTAGRRVGELTIEQYPGFTEREITRLANQVSRELGTLDLMVVHRVGAIRPGEAIVLVAALAAHRNAAFEAVRLLMDYLKTDAPLWKKESGPDGVRWIEPSAHDHARRDQAKEKSGEKV
ncbi:MAG TPA: molybdenum cofactor biosynthesis protein MoaE [Rhizomicrobium sp.]|jgi:molybdopterin synthase catalytic subunit|nr:molybdenum cofactor biosynthesis protein MoaE [Rhizomicrobium sp.]